MTSDASREGAADDRDPPDGRRAPRPARGGERKPMLLRLDPKLHAALARWAADDLRSTNAHVKWLLRKALSDAGRLPKRS